jgi:GH24 family phage-related lysozyme (muramidase)
MTQSNIIPPSDLPIGVINTINNTSDTSIPSASASTPVVQFIFNVELQDIFSNNDFGSLFIIGQEDETLLYDNGSDSFIDSEYLEDEFSGLDELKLEEFADYQDFPRSIDGAPDTFDTTTSETSTTKPDVVTPTKVNISGDSWEIVTANFLAKKEGFISRAKFDVDHYRAGFGTSKKLVGSNLVEVTATTTFTLQEAIATLSYQLRVDYEPIMKSSFGADAWSKLNKNQKAAIVSLAYNCGPGIYTTKGRQNRQFARVVYKGVVEGNANLISTGIASGPKTAKGKRLSALVQRRSEEAGLALA